MGKGARLRRNRAALRSAEHAVARQVQVGAPAGRIADQRDPFPIYTVLQHLGMSQGDVRGVGDRILKILRQKLMFKALGDDAGLKFRYTNDQDYRNRVNQEMVAEALMEVGFSNEELQHIRSALHLSHEIGGTPEKRGKTARARTEDGQEHEFEFLDAPADGEVGPTTLRDKTTGKVHTVNPDLS